MYISFSRMIINVQFPDWNKILSEVGVLKSCYDICHICPLRAEISTQKHWENVFILLFVWLVVIGFRQNYFHISPNFGDFGAKMSFFHYKMHQKRKIFIKHCSPVFQNATYIRDLYLYNKQSVQMGSWTQGRGAMSYRLKMGEGQLTAHEIPL